MNYQIPIEQTKNPHWTKELVERGEFGAVISDHMFVSNYENGHWINPKVVPYENLSLNPATLALHYGQSVFEGMKAFKMQDGSISIFRIEKHFSALDKNFENNTIRIWFDHSYAETPLSITIEAIYLDLLRFFPNLTR